MIERILDPNSPVSPMPSWNVPGVLPYWRRWSSAVKRRYRRIIPTRSLMPCSPCSAVPGEPGSQRAHCALPDWQRRLWNPGTPILLQETMEAIDPLHSSHLRIGTVIELVKTARRSAGPDLGVDSAAARSADVQPGVQSATAPDGVPSVRVSGTAQRG